jgi:hypothetical protein
VGANCGWSCKEGRGELTLAEVLCGDRRCDKIRSRKSQLRRWLRRLQKTSLPHKHVFSSVQISIRLSLLSAPSLAAIQTPCDQEVETAPARCARPNAFCAIADRISALWIAENGIV